MISVEVLNRKGARKLIDIPKGVLELLNKGVLETVNLTEWLAVNQTELIKNNFPKIGLQESVDNIVMAISQQKKPSTMSFIKVIGLQLYVFCKQNNILEETIQLLSTQESDTLRCYATYLIALNSDLDISDKLENSRNLIGDKHFGVREIVWMALRPEIADNLTQSIQILSEWTKDSDENVRRFTTEVTRPRGVWCKHIEALKENPETGLIILEQLKSDKSIYVQNSVGNWLNDASKTQPEFVINLCKKWKNDSPTTETKKIIKRALRTITK